MNPNFITTLLCILLFGGLTLNAQSRGTTPSRPTTPSPANQQAGGTIMLGIDVLEADGFNLLRGKRVGLLTNPAGVNRNGISTIDVLRRSPQVNLVALFGPEHGIYGDEKANVPVDDKIDTRTGLPVYSLYGRFRRPTRQMLDQIDVMVIDLQDLGVRSYTYVSCMRYVIEECFKANKEVVVLDRPNPLGGLKVDGPPLEQRWKSYVGAFQVPYVHGLTIGELANMAVHQPGVLEVDDATRQRGRLTVVRMRGWQRSMQWPATGLRWIPTSPAIPDLSAVMGYSMTGLGTQLGGFRHGYGTIYPFRVLQFPGKQPEEIMQALRARNIPGLDYRIVTFTEGGQPRRGVYVLVSDWNALRPTELSFHMMAIAAQWSASNPFAAATSGQADLFNEHVGSTEWWNALTTQGAAVDVDRFVRQWSNEARTFQQHSRQFWLYQ
jgi:uncharacterized protein YbbC (DUF1343 family)